MFKKRNFIDFESAQYCKFAMDTTILDPILLIFIDFLASNVLHLQWVCRFSVIFTVLSPKMVISIANTRLWS